MARNRSDTTNTKRDAMSALEAAEQVEATFQSFVQNALRDAAPAKGRSAASSARPDAADPPSSTTGKVLPLLRRKSVRPGPGPLEARGPSSESVTAPRQLSKKANRREITVRMEHPPPVAPPRAEDPAAGGSGVPGAPPRAAPVRRRGADATPLPSARLAPARRVPVPQRSEATVKRHQHEVAALIPDVAKVPSRGAAPREATEDGQMPANELDALLREMSTLLKYGHDAQVQIELDQVRHRYPRDLLLLRRVAEFHLERRDHDRAIEVLFHLASGLFDRKNVEGMRAALEQVLKLDPGNRRAMRLLGLLDRR